MAMLFGKKSSEPVPAPGDPTPQIIALKQQGVENTMIVDELTKQGYNPAQVNNALAQLNYGGPPMDLQQGPAYQAPPPQAPMQESFPAPAAGPEEPMFEQPVFDKHEIEEMAEAIIDEKWKDFEKDIGLIIEWKERTEATINQMKQQIEDVAANVNNLHKNIIAKISEYDRNITDVGTEIKAMEKVFQKVLPSLTENVNKLDRITKNYKK